MRVAKYYSEYDRYWCDTCQDYVDGEESGGKKPVHEPERPTSPPPREQPPVNTPVENVPADAAEDNPLATPIWTE